MRYKYLRIIIHWYFSRKHTYLSLSMHIVITYAHTKIIQNQFKHPFSNITKANTLCQGAGRAESGISEASAAENLQQKKQFSG